MTTTNKPEIFPGFIDEFKNESGDHVTRFKIYRPASLYTLGFFFTPLFIGYLTSGVLIAITLYFLAITNYSTLSIALTLIFTVPLLLVLNFYVIRPSLKALSSITLVEIGKDTIRIKNVFPNVIKGTIETIPKNTIKAITIQEAGSLGFRLLIERENEKNVPFGLFASKEDATLARQYFNKHFF